MLEKTESLQAKAGLLPTPARPKNLPPVELTENAMSVFLRRYARRGPDGKPMETAEDAFWRVAYHVAKAETEWGGDEMGTAEEFYKLLGSKRFFPNSPTFTGAGTPLGQLAACFVLPISDDMGRNSSGIFQTLRDAALIQQTGGGNGFAFSRLRPKNARVSSSAGRATGPVGFLSVYDKAFGEVAQGGTRRGANMAVLRVDHPDVEEFITCKTDENAITNFNISVGITDAFMRAVLNDTDWDLRFVDVNIPEGKGFDGTLEDAERKGLPIKVHKTVRARDLFAKIVAQAHHNGEPGLLFLDAANRSNPVPHLYPLEATNPCITGDTLIYTANGLQRAAELAKAENAQPVVVDGRFEVDTMQPASAVFATGVKEVFRLKMVEGYELRLTADHKVMTERGWVEASHLQSGDRVHILNRPGGFGGEGSRDLGLVLGWLVGDGTVNQVRAVLSFFGEEKRELAPTFAEAVTRLVDTGPKYRQRTERSYPVGLTQLPERDEARVQSDRLRLLAQDYGLDLDKLQVPDVIFRGSREAQQAFLQALFTADGSMQDGGEKGGSVRLTSVSYTLLQDVQRLLLNFGIASRIYAERRPAGYRRLPDGRGGYTRYWCQAYHELAVTKQNLLRFAEGIGFLSQAKQTDLLTYLERMTRGPYRESFTARVEYIEPDGRETVYDLNQPTTQSFIANGLVVHNCGEQWLGPYENCCLGSVNLAQHFGPDGTVDWEKLRESVELSTRFLDDVVQMNAYVPAVPQLKEAAYRARRIGLGVMGLADLMYHAGIRYGSEEGQEFVAQVMEFVRYHSMQTSIELAKERGPFEAIQGSMYDSKKMTWQAPKPLVGYKRNWGRPALDWDGIMKGIRKHGIRNAAQTTIAPTGTIATVSGCEGYGCEPAFALAYIRHVNDNGTDLELTYTSPLFEEALIRAGLDEGTRKRIIEQVVATGTCAGIAELPKEIADVFAVSGDISAEEHVRMQAAMQAFVDNSLSKTINFPPDATEEDVATAYRLAWELGCKGITVYVTGSREKVVLETHATAAEKKNPMAQPSLWNEGKKPRPRQLAGHTFNVDTPIGKAFVTINENGGEQPFEVFLNTAKAGSETAAVSEAIGRLISYILRLSSPVEPRQRLWEVFRQLEGIGGERALGFGPNRIRSLPDGVARILNEYLKSKEEPREEAEGGNGNGHEIKPAAMQPSFEAEAPAAASRQIGDICPDCGHAAMVSEEGCRKCYNCGYSEC